VKWTKRGVIFSADGQHDWMMHHACVPVADPVDDSVMRIYFAPRDNQGRSRAGFIDVEAANPENVLAVSDHPVLDLGDLGAFDDSGVMPCSIVNVADRKFMFYVGWNVGVTVSYRNAVGLAVSDDGGHHFARVFEGPIVDRTRFEPYFCASPFAMLDEGTWRMWYASSTGFEVVDGRPEPVYQIKYAESSDGLDWRRPNITCIEYTFPGEANARPYVIKEDGRYQMWYCFRGSVGYRTDPTQSYRLGYAESLDGLTWTRLDDLVGIERSSEGWDSLMMEYPCVYEHGGAKFLLYNGNGFGATGIGYAVSSDQVV
jgi:hypothetical protein